MTKDLKPYAENKDTGAPWFGTVPKHWNVGRLGAVFSERGETNERREVTDILSVMKDHGVIPYAEKGRVGNKASDDVGRYKIVRPDDLVVNCMNVIIGSVGRSRYTGCLSPVYYVLKRRKPENNPRFLELVFQHKQFQQSLVRIGNGILAHRMRIPMEKLKAEMFPLPPPDEQAAIVRFLDHANRKIDGFIRAKRKLIGLLNEQKQAIIHRAVTRGLNPNVPLKPSGIPWLGDIPQHWTLKRFKFIARINSGQVDPRESRYRKLVLIAPNHIQSGSGRLLAQETADKQGADSGKYLVSRGQIIYSKIRPNLRKATIAPCDCLCSADMYPITPTKEVLPEFLLLLLLSQPFTKFAVDCSMRVAMPKVNREALANCLMWYPEPDEQRKVLMTVERESAPYDTAIARTEREIALMQEYRTRLTTDIVTGKLDVREAAKSLPDMVEEIVGEDMVMEEDLEESISEDIPIEA